MGKIQMQTPLVEMDGDEMTRILSVSYTHLDVYKRQLRNGCIRYLCN